MTYIEQAIQKAIVYHKTGGGWNKGMRMKPLRKCSECSRSDPTISFYSAFKVLLCEKHYQQYKKYGRAVWGDKRPLKTRRERIEKESKIGIEWRQSVFKRDNYTCQICKIRGTKLEAHHIKPFAYFPELRWITSNGQTLCIPCHKLTDSWGRKGQKLYGRS